MRNETRRLYRCQTLRELTVPIRSYWAAVQCRRKSSNIKSEGRRI